MIPYVLCYCFCIYFSYRAETVLKCNKKIWFTVYSLLTVLLPTVLAGCRDYSVGVDINIYVHPAFEYALKYSSLVSFLEFNAAWYKSVDVLFAILVYVVSRFTNNCHWVLLVISALINGFFYAGFVKMRQYTKIWFGMAMFLLYYYIPSLNIMRQMLAAAIIFYSFSYLLEKEYVKFVLGVAIAALFHSSGLFGFVYLLIHKYMKGRYKAVKSLFLMATATAISLFLPYFVSVLVHVGVFPVKYLNYVSGHLQGSKLNIVLIALCFIRLMIVVLNEKVLLKINNNNDLLLQCGILDFMLYFLKVYSEYASRLNLYTGPAFCLLAGQLPSAATEDHNKKLYAAFLLGIGFIYWMYSFVVQGYHSAIPFVFSINP